MWNLTINNRFASLCDMNSDNLERNRDGFICGNKFQGKTDINDAALKDAPDQGVKDGLDYPNTLGEKGDDTIHDGTLHDLDEEVRSLALTDPDKNQNKDGVTKEDTVGATRAEGGIADLTMPDGAKQDTGNGHTPEDDQVPNDDQTTDKVNMDYITNKFGLVDKLLGELGDNFTKLTGTVHALETSLEFSQNEIDTLKQENQRLKQKLEDLGVEENLLLPNQKT